MLKQLPPLLRQAVALQAALRFVGHCHFDQAQFEETTDLFVQLPRKRGVTQRFRQFGFPIRLDVEKVLLERLAFELLQEVFDWLGTSIRE